MIHSRKIVMNTSDYFIRVKSQTLTRFWINNVTREQAGMAIAAGATGCTQNPSYVNKMLNDSIESTYAFSKLDGMLDTLEEPDKVQELLQRELVREIAGIFRPLYDASHGREGFVSIQGNPLFEDYDSIVAGALFNREAGSNIMAKIPATLEGLEAIEVLMEQGIPINATEVMCTSQVVDLCEIHERVSRKMAAVPPVYISHITGILDEYLQLHVKRQGIEISPDMVWQAGMICARKAHRIIKERGCGLGFIGGGARGLQHFTEMVGSDACITINWTGCADKLLELNPPVVDRFHVRTPELVLDTLLLKIDEFDKAWSNKAVNPEEYEEFGPVVLFRSSFESAWRNANEIIQKRIHSKKVRK